MGVLLQVTDVTKIYANQPKPGLDGVCFEVNEGEFLGIMGASGSGKTTLLNVPQSQSRPARQLSAHQWENHDGPNKYPEVEPNAGGGLPQKQPWLYFPRILPFGQLDSPGKYRRSVDITA